jgi:hypothetical protein
MSADLATAFAGVLTLVALSACGSADQADQAPATSAATATTAPTTTRTGPMPTTSSGPPEDLTVAPTGPSRRGTSIRVRGTVSDGVEQGCRLLTSNGVVYLLIWRGGNLDSGREIEVQGTVQPHLMTTCQQGTPLVVERVISP